MKDQPKILIIGACGQIGTGLTAALTRQYGEARVMAAYRYACAPDPEQFPNYRQLDALDRQCLAEVVRQDRITQVYLLAAMRSARGEQHREQAWKLNVNSLLHVLNLAVGTNIEKVFWPSSIVVFGPRS
jgi:nucleoside-diphosphate-sugar epimerase